MKRCDTYVSSTEENQQRLARFERELALAEEDAQRAIDAAYTGWRVGLFADGSATDVEGLPQALLELLAQPTQERTKRANVSLEEELRAFFDQQVRDTVTKGLVAFQRVEEKKREFAEYRGDKIPRVMIMSDEKPRPTSILARGEYLKPTIPVSFATPAFLLPLPVGAPANRLGFAQWLVSDDHPLTARVQVNRMWQYFFGTGLVMTSEDFGVQSEYPLHRALLDWLAVEFRERGWSRKRMHRLILTSATYRQASRLTDELRQRDRGNRLFARASRLRMPAMILRDWALGASGLLQTTIHPVTL